MSTYNTPYKSGTITAISGTTLTVSGFTPQSTDIGRFLIVTTGNARLQVREITAVSGTNVTIAHPMTECAFLEVSEINPAIGDSIAISYRIDDLIAGDADLTLTSANNLEIAFLEVTANAYIQFENLNTVFDSGNIEIGQGAGLIFGKYSYVANEDAYVRRTCNIVDTNSSSINNNQMGRGTSPGGDFGLLHIYGGNVLAENPGFWRIYDTNLDTNVRFIDTVFKGDFGSRIEGAKSIVKVTAVDASTTVGFSNFLTIGRVELSALNCDQAIYVSRVFGPNGRAVLKRIADIKDKVLNVRDSGNGIFEVIAKKTEIDTAPAFLTVTGSVAGHTVRYGNLIKPRFINANGSTVTDNVRTRLYDVNGTFIEQNVITDGIYPEVFVRHTDISGSITGDVNLSDGVLYAPYTMRIMVYGKQFNDTNISAGDTFDAEIVLLNDLNITETSKATVDAYTELDSALKLYDRASAWLTDNLTDETGLLLSRSGNVINASALNIVIDSNAAQVFNFDGTTITFKTNTFTGDITTTGNITLLGSVTINGAIASANLDSTLQFSGVDSWKLYASASDRDSNINLVDEGTIGNYFFTFSSGTTYYLRLAAGNEIIFKDITPLTSGVTTVELSTTGLLSALPSTIDTILVDRLDGADLPGATATAVWDTLTTEITTPDSIGVYVKNISGGGGGGADAATIYTYFTTDSRQDVFKADVSNTATATNVTDAKDEIITEISQINTTTASEIWQYDISSINTLGQAGDTLKRTEDHAQAANKQTQSA